MKTTLHVKWMQHSKHEQFGVPVPMREADILKRQRDWNIFNNPMQKLSVVDHVCYLDVVTHTNPCAATD